MIGFEVIESCFSVLGKQDWQDLVKQKILAGLGQKFLNPTTESLDFAKKVREFSSQELLFYLLEQIAQQKSQEVDKGLQEFFSKQENAAFLDEKNENDEFLFLKIIQSYQSKKIELRTLEVAARFLNKPKRYKIQIQKDPNIEVNICQYILINANSENPLGDSAAQTVQELLSQGNDLRVAGLDSQYFLSNKVGQEVTKAICQHYIRQGKDASWLFNVIRNAHKGQKSRTRLDSESSESSFQGEQKTKCDPEVTAFLRSIIIELIADKSISGIRGKSGSHQKSIASFLLRRISSQDLSCESYEKELWQLMREKFDKLQPEIFQDGFLLHEIVKTKNAGLFQKATRLIATNQGLESEIYQQEKSGKTAFHLACETGFDGAIKFFVNDLDQDIFQKIANKLYGNLTPLTAIIRRGYEDSLKELLGSEVVELNPDYYPDPLLTAIENFQENMALTLLEKGAKPNKIDKEGKSALLLAIEKESFAMVEALIKHGAEIDCEKEYCEFKEGLELQEKQDLSFYDQNHEGLKEEVKGSQDKKSTDQEQAPKYQFGSPAGARLGTVIQETEL